MRFLFVFLLLAVQALAQSPVVFGDTETKVFWSVACHEAAELDPKRERSFPTQAAAIAAGFKQAETCTTGGALAAAAAAAADPSARNAPLTATVIAVADGDTITVLTTERDQLRVRLAGIDAPEKGQDYSDRSKQNLSDLVFGKTVQLEGDKTDRYGRRVAKVLIGDVDANLEQVKAGLAWHYKEYAREQTLEDREAYAKAEISAREKRLNLWSYHAPTPPWDFRSGRTFQPAIVEGSATQGRIIGNRNSMIYHWPGCPSYNKVAPRNRVYFATPAAAEAAGYRAARNCGGPPPR